MDCRFTKRYQTRQIFKYLNIYTEICFEAATVHFWCIYYHFIIGHKSQFIYHGVLQFCFIWPGIDHNCQRQLEISNVYIKVRIGVPKGKPDKNWSSKGVFLVCVCRTGAVEFRLIV